MERENEMIVISHRLFLLQGLCTGWWITTAEQQEMFLGGVEQLYRETSFISWQDEKWGKGYFQKWNPWYNERNADSIELCDSISVSLTQEPFKNRWYETEEHGYERKNEAVLPRCNDETREKSGGVNKRSTLCFSRPHDRKSIFLSCGLFAFGRNGKFTSLSQRMSKALSIVRAGGDLNPSEPDL